MLIASVSKLAFLYGGGGESWTPVRKHAAKSSTSVFCV